MYLCSVAGQKTTYHRAMKKSMVQKQLKQNCELQSLLLYGQIFLPFETGVVWLSGFCLRMGLAI